jgi:hypothetical protein
VVVSTLNPLAGPASPVGAQRVAARGTKVREGEEAWLWVTLRARWVTLRARWVTAKSSLGDAESSLGDAKSSLGDAKSSLGDG